MNSSESLKTAKVTFVKKNNTNQNHRQLSAAINMTLFTQQMTVMNDSSSDTETLLSGSTSSNSGNYSNRKKEKKDKTKSGKYIIQQEMKH